MKVFPIIDENEKRRLSSLAKAIADEPAHFSRTWLADKKWTVVPVESASHFDERDAERLARAFRGLGWGEIFAIATEPLDDFPTCFAVNASNRLRKK